VKKIIVCLLLFVLFSCEDGSKPYSIAIDKNWYPIVLNGQESLVNGFFSEVLLQIAKNKKIEISLVDTN